MSLLRQLNRCLNRLIHPLTGGWIFIHGGKAKVWYPVTKKIEGKQYLLNYRFEYASAVEEDSEDIKSLAAFVATFDKNYIEAVREFVQSVPYTSDETEPTGKDWVKTPTETLVTGKADCEDLSVLFVSLARHKGYNAHMAWLKKPANYKGLNHVVACIDAAMLQGTVHGETIIVNNGTYYLLECTSPHPIGELAEVYKSWPRTFIDCGGLA